MSTIPVSVVIKKIEELLTIEWGNIAPPVINTVILDLNSTLNTVFRVEGLAEYGVDIFINEISHLLRTFIHTHTNKKIVILYNTEKTYLKEKLGDKYLSFFYDERPPIADTIIKHFIDILGVLGDKTKINVVDTGKFEVALVAYILKNRGPTLVISRNPVVIQTVADNGYHWNGLFMFNKDVPLDKIYSNRNLRFKPDIPKELPMSMYPYYIYMRGIPGHGYAGLPKYGTKLALKYVTEHIIDIIDGKDTTVDYSIMNWFVPSRTVLEIISKDEKLRTELSLVMSKTKD